MDDQNENELEFRLRKMKAINYAQQREVKLIKQIFHIMASNYKEKQKKYDKYYKMILCLKSFKGIMDYGIMQCEQKILQQSQQRRKQEECNKRKNDIQQERIQNSIKAVEKNRKAIYFKKIYSNNLKKTGQKNKKTNNNFFESIPNERKQQLCDKSIKTDNIFKLRQIQFLEKARQGEKSGMRFLQNSRRSTSSQGYLSQDLQAKRKYAVIKALPPKPVISCQQSQNTFNKYVEPSINNQSNQKGDMINEHEQKGPPNKLDIKLEQIAIQNQQDSLKNFSIKNIKQSQKRKQESLNPLLLTSLKQQAPLSAKKKKQSSSKYLERKKDEILGFLSEIKMVEIIELTEIIEQYDKKLKDQANINEKRYIKQSLKLLERISFIN